MSTQAMPQSPFSTLGEHLEREKQAFLADQPQRIQRTVMNAFERLMASDVAKDAKGLGDEAPDFELPDAWGSAFRLTTALARGPVVLSFYRGGWCPFCNLEFKALRDALPEMRALGATLVAVSPQDLAHSRETVSDLGLDFPVLSDQGNKLSRQYGLLMTLDDELRPVYREWGINLAEANADESNELPVPATYVIDRQSIIRAAYVEKDYTRRMEPTQIINTLKAFSDGPRKPGDQR